MLQFLFFRSLQNFQGDFAFDYWKTSRVQHRKYRNSLFVENTPQVNFIFVSIVF